MPHYRHPHEELFWRVQKRFLTKGASYKSGPSKGRRPLGSECCVTAGDSGDEAYTAIAWGVGLSHERSDIRGRECLVPWCSNARQRGLKTNASLCAHLLHRIYIGRRK